MTGSSDVPQKLLGQLCKGRAAGAGAVIHAGIVGHVVEGVFPTGRRHRRFGSLADGERLAQGQRTPTNATNATLYLTKQKQKYNAY